MKAKFKAIKDVILSNIKSDGNYPTSIKGVNFVRRDSVSEFLKCFYKPACIFVLEGEKQMLYGNSSYTYGSGNFVVSCTDVPVTSKITKASPKNPFLAVVLDLDSNLISNLILETKLQKNVMENEKCIGIADIDDSLLDAFLRLVNLSLKSKDEIEILSPIVIKEIYYRLLVGPLGNELRLINTKGTRSNQIASAILYLKDRFNEKLSIEEIAEYVNMAPSSFYRNFRKITNISPLQFQKQLRLYEAQRLMLTGEHNAESAGYLVGYESPTQFSREYKKMFGNPPKADIKKLVTV